MGFEQNIAEDKLPARLCSGDEKAFDQIFKLLYKPLCFFANKILEDQD